MCVCVCAHVCVCMCVFVWRVCQTVRKGSCSISVWVSTSGLRTQAAIKKIEGQETGGKSRLVLEVEMSVFILWGCWHEVRARSPNQQFIQLRLNKCSECAVVYVNTCVCVYVLVHFCVFVLKCVWAGMNRHHRIWLHCRLLDRAFLRKIV